MMWALVWKEYREQRNIWIALAMFGVLGLVPPTLVFAPDGFDHKAELQDALGVVALVLAWTQGMVSGAILFAGEWELGTLTFLDQLPGSRRQMWWSKLLAGLLLVLLQAAFLIGLGGWLGLTGERIPLALGILVILLLSLLGLAWGVFCSALSRTVLSAIGLALMGQFLAGPAAIAAACILLLPLVVVCNSPEPLQARYLVAGVLVLFGPFVGSALLFAEPDQQRGMRTGFASRKEWQSGWRATWWLAWKQQGWFPLALLAFALVGGLLLPLYVLFLWPILTLAAGIVCGVTVFLDEQQTGSWRFLGDQRIPLGRFWCVKAGQRLGLVLLAVGLMFVPSIFVTWGDPEAGSQPWVERSFQGPALNFLVPPGLFLTMWVLYGFTIGHLCSLVFRKPLVALVVSTGLSVLLAGAWIPSLLGGGLQAWQVLGVPVLLLIAARCLLRPWACDRLGSGWPLTGILGTLLLTALLVVGGIGYRVIDVPDIPEPMPLADYLAGFPPPEQNEAASLIRTNCRRATELAAELRRQRGPGLFPGLPIPLDEAVQNGWPDKEPEAAALLDAVFAEPWANKLLEAADLLTGVVVDPRRLSYSHLEGFDQMALQDQVRTTVPLLAVRGLQLQARGDPAAFVDLCKAGLGVCRNLHNRAPRLPAAVARGSQLFLMSATERWLEKLDGHPELIRRLLEVYRENGETLFTDQSGEQWAEYLLALNSLDDPQEWIVGKAQPDRPSELALIQGAWLVPWERQRHLRLVRLMFWGDAERFFHQRQVGREIFLFHMGFGQRDLRRQLTQLRALELMLALRLYQAEKGRPARSLEELVPRYLERIPNDPFDNLPFRYRLSTGEKIVWPTQEQFPFPGVPGGPGPGGAGGRGGPELLPPPVEDPAPPGKAELPPADGPELAPGLPPGIPPQGIPGGLPPFLAPPAFIKVVPAGQGILWSVGEDGRDDGGLRQFTPGQPRTVVGEDIIFLVPLPARKAAK